MSTNLNIPFLHGAGGCVEEGLFKSNSASTSIDAYYFVPRLDNKNANFW